MQLNFLILFHFYVQVLRDSYNTVKPVIYNHPWNYKDWSYMTGGSSLEI